MPDPFFAAIPPPTAMNRSRSSRRLPTLTLAVALATLPSLLSAQAAPKIEETVLGPTNVGGSFVVAPRGGHVAYIGRQGDKLAVSIDGVPGPAFDDLYKVHGELFFYSPKAQTLRASLGGGMSIAGSDVAVAFSLDGEHHAYIGRQGSEYVVIHDGREIGRGPSAKLSWGGEFGLLTLSPRGKLVLWSETEMDPQGRTFARQFVSGKAGPWNLGAVPVAFNADETRTAFFLAQRRDTGKPALIVDGKEAGYVGTRPAFTADGSILLTVTTGEKPGLLANGKPVLVDVTITKIITAPVGSRWAAIGQAGNRPPMSGVTLFVDGREVPGSEHVQEVWFSPDGKRYAARCQDMAKFTHAMVVDGESYAFKRVDALAPTWTADSSKLLFTGATDTGEVIVINDAAYDHPGNASSSITVAESGDRFAYGGSRDPSRSFTVIVGEQSILPDGAYPTSRFTFSPDGSRHGFHVGRIGRAETTGLMLDGSLVPGLTPGFFKHASMSSLPTESVRFSPDGRHAAFMGRTGAARKNSLFLDGTNVFPDTDLVYRATFSPDGKHIFWSVDEKPLVTAVYVDGQPVIRANASFFAYLPGSWEVDGGGVATFLAADGEVAKRYRITPAPDTSVAALIANGPAVAATPKPPTPVAVVPPPSSTPARPPAATTAAPTPAPPATPAAALTWNDLVRRPEARPTMCTVSKEYRFQGGAVVRPGTQVNIIELKPGDMVLETQDGRITFGAKPEETDVLAVANTAWAQLTPAQRELTYPAVLKRTDLWPYRLKLRVPYTLEGAKTRAGDSALFIGLENNQLLISHEATKLLFTVEASETDLMAQARTLVASEGGAPGRVLEELAGKLQSPLTGQPVALDTAARPKLVVMYRGAGWCGPCLAFSPDLVKVLKAKSPAATDVALIYVSGDRSPAEARAYATKIGIDWPMIAYKSRDQMPAFNTLFGDTIPQLVVTDRHGKVLVDSNRVGTAQALLQLQKLL